MDFTNPPDDLEDEWSTSNFATVTYNTKGKNGAEFTFEKRYDSPQLFTNFYIFYGRVDVEMQVAPGIGIISSSVLMSDSFDEIDWEMSGNNFNLSSLYPSGVVQNNYFSKGITGTYDRGMWVPLANPQTTFYTYSVDWTPEKLDWLVNGKVVRTFRAKDADTTTHQYPQTPSKVQLGLWDGGDPGQNDGTKRWSGGITDFSKAPFTMFVRSVRITNYNPAMYYNWTNQSGSSKSIKALNVTLPDPTMDEPTTIATTLEPLRTDLPLSPNGHCGKDAGICKGSLFGDCCSFYNFCGNTTEYCGLGCQSAFGICGPMNPIATTGLTSAPAKTTSPSTIATQSSTVQTSVLTNPTTTVIISLSRTSTGQSAGPTSAAPELPTDKSLPASSSTTTKADPPTQPPTTAESIQSTETGVPASTTLSAPVPGPTSTKGSKPDSSEASIPTSNPPVPPVIEKPVVSTDKDSLTDDVSSLPDVSTDTKKPGQSSTAKDTLPTSKIPVPPISTGNQGLKPTTTAQTSTQPTTSTAKASAPPTTRTTAPTAITTAPKPSTTQGPTANPTTAKTTAETQLNYVATTLPAKPTASAAAPKPSPRKLCFWWGRWYCWIYKRTYPIEARAYRAMEG